MWNVNFFVVSKHAIKSVCLATLRPDVHIVHREFYRSLNNLLLFHPHVQFLDCCTIQETARGSGWKFFPCLMKCSSFRLWMQALVGCVERNFLDFFQFFFEILYISAYCERWRIMHNINTKCSRIRGNKCTFSLEGCTPGKRSHHPPMPLLLRGTSINSILDFKSLIFHLYEMYLFGSVIEENSIRIIWFGR